MYLCKLLALSHSSGSQRQSFIKAVAQGYGGGPHYAPEHFGNAYLIIGCLLMLKWAPYALEYIRFYNVMHIKHHVGC